MAYVFSVDCALRLLASLFCAVVLGFERKRWQHTVGPRTIILISLSCTLLCMLSTYLSRFGGAAGRGDPTRIAAGVVTGIGFLGGGAIMRQGLNIRGLTSAAVIWTTAALGLSCGAALYIPSFIVLCISLITLITLERVEGHYSAEKTKTITITYKIPADTDSTPSSIPSYPPTPSSPPSSSAISSPALSVSSPNPSPSPAFSSIPSPSASSLQMQCGTGETREGSVYSLFRCHEWRKVLEQEGYIVRDVNIQLQNENGNLTALTIEYSVKSPPTADPLALAERIQKTEYVKSVAISDGL